MKKNDLLLFLVIVWGVLFILSGILIYSFASFFPTQDESTNLLIAIKEKERGIKHLTYGFLALIGIRAYWKNIKWGLILVIFVFGIISYDSRNTLFVKSFKFDYQSLAVFICYLSFWLSSLYIMIMSTIYLFQKNEKNHV